MYGLIRLSAPRSPHESAVSVRTRRPLTGNPHTRRHTTGMFYLLTAAPPLPHSCPHLLPTAASPPPNNFPTSLHNCPTSSLKLPHFLPIAPAPPLFNCPTSSPKLSHLLKTFSPPLDSIPSQAAANPTFQSHLLCSDHWSP